MILFLLMNLIAGLSSFLVAYKFFRLESFSDSLICWFALYFAQVVLSEMPLALSGALSLPNLIILNVFILLAVILCSRKRRLSFEPAKAKASLSLILNDRIAFAGFCLLSGFVLIKLVFNLVNPPFGWDSLNYHYTFAVEWLKNAKLALPIVASDDPFPSYYPLNGSLFFLWLILPFKSAFLADLGQFPFFAVSFLGVYSICRKLKLGPEPSFFAALLFSFIPNYFKQLQIGYVDIMVAGMFICGLNFLIRLKDDFSRKNIFIFSLAVGLFIGIKTTCLPYAVFLLLPFLCLLIKKEGHSFSKVTYFLSFSFLLIFLLGGFSYFRNMLLAGNPFYPLRITLFGSTLFPGVIDKATFIARREIGGGSLTKLLFHEGLGPQAFIIILPAALSAFFINTGLNKNKGFFLNYLMLLPLILYLVYRFILPLPNSRYLYPMLAAGICVGFYSLRLLRFPLIALRAVSLALVLASAFDCSRKYELVFSFIAAFLLFMSFRKNPENIFGKKFCLAAAVAGILLLPVAFKDYQKNEYGRYIKNSRYWPEATQAWAWLNLNTKADNVAYVGKPVPFPLYGTGLKNNVYYVSVNSIDPIYLHSLKGSRYRWGSAEGMHRSFEESGNYRGNADYSAWLANLKKRNTDLLFIYSLHHTKETIFPLEERWARENTAEFKQVFANEGSRIYRLKQ